MKPDKNIEELLDYLPEDERIVSSYRLGVYDIMTTTERVILLRKFPKSFVEVLYEDIDSLEHLTRIQWGELFNGLAMMGIGAFAYTYNKTNGDLVALFERLSSSYLPELLRIIPADKAVLFLIVFLALLGAYHTANFVPSLWGYFRISRKGRSPVMIHTSLTPEVRDLIREIQAHVKEKAKEKAAPAAAAAPSGTEEEGKGVVFRKLGSSMKGLGNNAIVIITSQSKDHMQVVSSMLKILIDERKMGGVYLSVSRPYEYIMSAMAAVGIDSKDVYFIDCISKMAGRAESKDKETIVFVENPSSLEELSMYLDRMLAKVSSKEKFLFLDSIDSLLIYNNDKSVKEFTHYIINKVRLEGTAGIILSIEKKEAEDLIKTLVPMCDSEIKV